MASTCLSSCYNHHQLRAIHSIMDKWRTSLLVALNRWIFSEGASQDWSRDAAYLDASSMISTHSMHSKRQVWVCADINLIKDDVSQKIASSAGVLLLRPRLTWHLVHLSSYEQRRKCITKIHANLVFQACILFFLRFSGKGNWGKHWKFPVSLLQACISFLRRFRLKWRNSVFALFA